MNIPFFSSVIMPEKSEKTEISTSIEPLSSIDIIAPPSIEVDFDNLHIGDWYFRTLFTAGYPRFVSANWLEPLVSFDHTLDIAMYIYPTQSAEILENIRRKVGEMEATIQSDLKRGRVIEPSIQIALEDALSMQQQLAKGAERFFQFSLYVTIPAKTMEELNKTTKQVEAMLAHFSLSPKKQYFRWRKDIKPRPPWVRIKLEWQEIWTPRLLPQLFHLQHRNLRLMKEYFMA